VLGELRTALNDATATVCLAGAGLRKLAETFAGFPTQVGNADPQIHIGNGDPNQPESEVFANWRVSELVNQTVLNGPADTRLGHQWIVTFYAHWEEDIRPRLATAHGCGKDDIKLPLLGDLRWLRHCVVHRKGISRGFGEVLQWFGPGEGISLRGEHYAEFHRKFPWDELRLAPGAHEGN